MSKSAKIVIRELKNRSISDDLHSDSILVEYSDHRYHVMCDDQLTDDWCYEIPSKKATLALIMFRIRYTVEGILDFAKVWNQRLEITISTPDPSINVNQIFKFEEILDDDNEDEIERKLKNYTQKFLKETRVYVADMLEILKTPMKPILYEGPYEEYS